MLQPHGGFGDAFLNPKRDQGRKNPNKEDHAPVSVLQNDARHQRSQSVSDGPGALHNGNSLRAQMGWPGFGDQGGSRVPLSTHAEAQDETERGEHENRSRESGGEGAKGVSQDAEHQGALASNAVGEKA